MAPSFTISLLRKFLPCLHFSQRNHFIDRVEESFTLPQNPERDCAGLSLIAESRLTLRHQKWCIPCCLMPAAALFLLFLPFIKEVNKSRDALAYFSSPHFLLTFTESREQEEGDKQQSQAMGAPASLSPEETDTAGLTDAPSYGAQTPGWEAMSVKLVQSQCKCSFHPWRCIVYSAKEPLVVSITHINGMRREEGTFVLIIGFPFHISIAEDKTGCQGN